MLNMSLSVVQLFAIFHCSCKNLTLKNCFVTGLLTIPLETEIATEASKDEKDLSVTKVVFANAENRDVIQLSSRERDSHHSSSEDIVH